MNDPILVLLECHSKQISELSDLLFKLTESHYKDKSRISELEAEVKSLERLIPRLYFSVQIAISQIPVF